LRLGPFGHEVTHARLSIVRRDLDLARARPAGAAVGSGGKCGLPPCHERRHRAPLRRARGAAIRPAVQRPACGTQRRQHWRGVARVRAGGGGTARAAPLPVPLRLCAAAGGTPRGSGPAVHRSASSRQCLGHAGAGLAQRVWAGRAAELRDGRGPVSRSRERRRGAGRLRSRPALRGRQRRTA
jgi:hypothetical protein